MKKNENKSELATFTILNPDFHVIENQLDQKMTKENIETIKKPSENVE